MFGGSMSPGLSFHCAEDAVQPLHEGGAEFVLPVRQDPFQMVLIVFTVFRVAPATRPNVRTSPPLSSQSVTGLGSRGEAVASPDPERAEISARAMAISTGLAVVTDAPMGRCGTRSPSGAGSA